MSETSPSADSHNDWHEVAELSQLDPEFPLGVEVEGEKIGIYQCGEAVHALEDICPHAFALMSQGYVEDGIIECPLHGARFEIAGGKCLNEIGQRDLKAYPVRVVDGRIAIKLKG
jgi:nitrite reductase/ring-hydroxylating ferredoxin subunit